MVSEGSLVLTTYLYTFGIFKRNPGPPQLPLLLAEQPPAFVLV